MSETFLSQLCCKMDYLFGQLLLAQRLSSRKSDIEKNSDDIYWNVWTNIKKLYARNNIFQKRIPNMNHLSFGPNFAFWGLLQDNLARSFIFSSYFFFQFFVVRQPWWATFLFSQIPQKSSKKLPTALKRFIQNWRPILS